MPRRRSLLYPLMPPILAGLCAGACGGDGGESARTAAPVSRPGVRVTAGPVLGGVTSRSAQVWIQTEAQATVAVHFAASGGNGSLSRSSQALVTSATTDFAATVLLEDLRPGDCYDYRVVVDARPQTEAYQFCTFPDQADEVVVGLLADLDRRDAWPAPSIAALAGNRPDLLIILGDWDHRNPASADEIREMHRINRSAAKSAGEAMRTHFLGKVPVAYVWDDHDYGQNNSDRFSPLREMALAAYADYWPAYPRPRADAGIWGKFGYAELVEFFLLDLRSQRDPDTYKDPRFIPDAQPGANREMLRRDPQRSLLDGAAQPEGLGTGQKEWLKQSLLSSPFPWKVIVSTVTWNGTTVKDDAWWDFLAERQELLDFVRANGITGVIFASGDIHTGGGIDDGTHADLPEMTIPSANLNETEQGNPTCSTHSSEEQATYATCGSWSEGLFLHGAGYGLLRLGRATATLETHNQLGQSLTLTLAAGSPP